MLCGDEFWDVATPKDSSESPRDRTESPGTRDQELWEARRQVNEECRILGRTKTSLIKEVTHGAKEMQLMGARMTQLLEPIQDACCDMCVLEGRFLKMP